MRTIASIGIMEQSFYTRDWRLWCSTHVVGVLIIFQAYVDIHNVHKTTIPSNITNGKQKFGKLVAMYHIAIAFINAISTQYPKVNFNSKNAGHHMLLYT